jgi:hypothetical protein
MFQPSLNRLVTKLLCGTLKNIELELPLIVVAIEPFYCSCEIPPFNYFVTTIATETFKNFEFQ